MPSSKRGGLLVTGGLAFVLALFAVGCPQPADLENADAYAKDPRAGSGDTGGTGGGGATPSCETSCVKDVLTVDCVTCHSAATKFAGLDLETAGVTERLKDKPAGHAMVADASGCPTGDKLIDSANVAQSWLLKKITNEQGSCGTVMPTVPLTGEKLQCMKDYVNCVATSSSSGGGGQTNSAGAATGGGGAAAAGGGSGGASSGGGGTGGTGGA